MLNYRQGSPRNEIPVHNWHWLTDLLSICGYLHYNFCMFVRGICNTRGTQAPGGIFHEKYISGHQSRGKLADNTPLEYQFLSHIFDRDPLPWPCACVKISEYLFSSIDGGFLVAAAGKQVSSRHEEPISSISRLLSAGPD